MAESLAETIKTNFLNCAICLEVYHDPRALPCQHSFCRECLEQSIGSSADKCTLVCPVCRTEVKLSRKGIDELPVHFLVNSLQETVDMEQKVRTSSIAHVAVRKRQQRQDEIIIFFTHTVLESAKFFFFCQYARISYKCMFCEKRAIIVSVQVYAVQTGLR